MQYWGPGRVVVGVHMPRDKRPGSHSSRCPCERGACAIKMPRTKGYARKKHIAQQAHGRRPRRAPSSAVFTSRRARRAVLRVACPQISLEYTY